MCILTPLREKTGKETTDKFHRKVVTRWGAPEVLVTDRGNEWDNHIFKGLLEMYGIQHRMTSAFNPASNGKCERIIVR